MRSEEHTSDWSSDVCSSDLMPLGSHDMFLAEVVNVQADDRYIDPATGRFSLEAARPIVYSHGHYFRLGEMLGHFGWSVRRKKTRSGGR